LEEKFAAGWKDITPKNIGPIDRNRLANDFSANYTNERMKGKKGGLWNTVTSKLFEKNVLDDIFSRVL